MFKEDMKDLITLIKHHTAPSGIFSVTNIILGFQVIGAILKYISITIGIIVGLITIYTWLEKKGLIPKWLYLPDKDSKKSDKTDNK